MILLEEELKRMGFLEERRQNFVLDFLFFVGWEFILCIIVLCFVFYFKVLFQWMYSVFIKEDFRFVGVFLLDIFFF